MTRRALAPLILAAALLLTACAGSPAAEEETASQATQATPSATAESSAATSPEASSTPTPETTTPDAPTTPPAVESPAVVAPPQPPPAETVTPAGVPTSCDGLYDARVEGLLAEQGFVPTIGEREHFPVVLTMDTPANQIAADRFGFWCGLAVDGASGEALRTQVVTGLPPEEREHVVSVLPLEGFTCSELVGGQWCTGEGKSHFLREDVWIASSWTVAPEGYTRMLAENIWGS